MTKNKVHEPVVNPDNYNVSLSHALYWYHKEKEKKDARSYLREYINKHFTKKDVKVFDKLPDNKIVNTYAWVARLVLNSAVVLKEHDHVKLDNYLQSILNDSDTFEEVVEKEEVKVSKPSVRENMEEKVREYIGELEGNFDLVTDGADFDLYKDLQARAIPKPYLGYIEVYVKKKAGQFILAYENTNDSQIKEGYSNFTRRELTRIIKTLSAWLEDIQRYGQFKKANRKPRVKKIKPAGIQIAKLKYKREDTELGVKSVTPVEIVGSSQVWVFNTKNKKLAVYRTDSRVGIEVKGTTLQNYDPALCEQKTVRKPKETLKTVMDAGKIQLRKIISELNTKETPVTGRLNEDCLIVRVIK